MHNSAHVYCLQMPVHTFFNLQSNKFGPLLNTKIISIIMKFFLFFARSCTNTILDLLYTNSIKSTFTVYQATDIIVLNTYCFALN
jgi:hypothetical protein